MITREQAILIAQDYLLNLEQLHDYRAVGGLRLAEHLTREKPYGWVFFYDSARALQGESRYQLAGNAPFLVDRDDGHVQTFGTAYRIDRYLEAYEQEHGYPSA